ncbi:unnamed protein product, partial [Amoebophrya sp. A25]
PSRPLSPVLQKQRKRRHGQLEAQMFKQAMAQPLLAHQDEMTSAQKPNYPLRQVGVPFPFAMNLQERGDSLSDNNLQSANNLVAGRAGMQQLQLGMGGGICSNNKMTSSMPGSRAASPRFVPMPLPVVAPSPAAVPRPEFSTANRNPKVSFAMPFGKRGDVEDALAPSSFALG